MAATTFGSRGHPTTDDLTLALDELPGEKPRLSSVSQNWPYLSQIGPIVSVVRYLRWRIDDQHTSKKAISLAVG
jgi:hypothetical protein